MQSSRSWKNFSSNFILCLLLPPNGPVWSSIKFALKVLLIGKGSILYEVASGNRFLKFEVNNNKIIFFAVKSLLEWRFMLHHWASFLHWKKHFRHTSINKILNFHWFFLYLRNEPKPFDATTTNNIIKLNIINCSGSSSNSRSSIKVNVTSNFHRSKSFKMSTIGDGLLTAFPT